MTLSIVIPIFKVTKRTFENLYLLSKISEPNLIEIILVSNFESESLKEYCKRNYKFNYLCTQTAGANRARNTGYRNAKSDIVLFLDDDCVIDDFDILNIHINAFEQESDLWAHGGLYRFDCNQNSIADRTYYKLQMQWLERGFKQAPYYYSYLIGGHLSVNKKLIGDVTLFDDSIIYGGSETSFFHKFSDKKFRLNPGLFVLHKSNNSIFSLIKKACKQGTASGRRGPKTFPKVEPYPRFNLDLKLVGVEIFYARVYDFFFHLCRNKTLR
jgi:glycosyltransferase involved in cell wall biosynthesis